MNFRGGGMNAGKEKPRPIDRAAYEWRRSNEEAEEIIKYLDPEQWLEIRYENLCREKNATLRRIFEFLKVEPRAMYLIFVQQNITFWEMECVWIWRMK